MNDTKSVQSDNTTTKILVPSEKDQEASSARETFFDVLKDRFKRCFIDRW